MVPQLPPQRPGWPSQSSFRGGPTGEFVSWGPICTCKHEIPQTLGGLPKPWFIVGKNHHHISSLRVSFVNLHGCHCGFLLFRPFTLFTHQKPSVPESTQAAVERCSLLYQDKRLADHLTLLSIFLLPEQATAVGECVIGVDQMISNM